MAEFYNPGTNQWTTATPMNVARSVPGVASLGGSIYMAYGGYLYFVEVSVDRF
jgi:hypothetical protein